MISSKRKFILCLITVFILTAGMTFSVFAESGTAFTFTLEDKYNSHAIETIPSDLVPGAGKTEQAAEFPSPQTGDEASPICCIALMVISGSILTILYFSKLISSKK